MASFDEKPNWNKHVCGKGRRYTYVKLVYNKDRDYDVFGKFFVNPEILNKKQRAKVLRDNVDSSFDMNVAYSLNRKYRWEQISKADDLVSMDASVFSDKVKLDGCDAAYSIGRDTIVYGHCERNPDGSVQSTSNRAWTLVASPQYVTWQNIKKPPNDEDKQKLEVRYVLATVNPTERRYADKIFRRNDSLENWRKGKPLPHWFQPEFWDDSDVDDDEAEDEEAFDDVRTPTTFKLGDFITDNRRSKLNPSETSMESFEHVSAEPSEAAFATIADETSLCKDTFFIEFEMDGSQLCDVSISSFEQLSTSSKWTFRWLNSAKTSCAIDLSKSFNQAEENVVFVVVIYQLAPEKFKILLNGAFPICSDFVLQDLKEDSFPSLAAFLESCIAAFHGKYATTCLLTSRSISDCQSVFHPDEFRFTNGITPCTQPKFEQISLLIDAADDFEVVFADDRQTVSNILTPHCEKCTTKEATGYSISDGCSHNFCLNCLRSQLTDAVLCQTTYPLTCLYPNCMAPVRPEFLYVLLPLPITNFYFHALLKHESSANGTKLIECPHCRSFATIRERPQYNSVDCWNCSMCFCLGCGNRPHFPLTCEQFAVWMEKFELQRYLELSRADPNSVCKCQCGNILHHSNKTWKVSCRACGIKYNWKLRSKFDDGRIKLTNFADENTPNYIAAEYSFICLPVYEMRFDAKVFHDLKQHLRNLPASNSVLFISNFKLALHLIELGFAWLYLTKTRKSDEWTTLKSQLTQLRGLVDSITTAVRQRLIIVDVNQKAVELNKLVGWIMKDFSNVHI